jgi:hypothetical protein
MDGPGPALKPGFAGFIPFPLFLPLPKAKYIQLTFTLCIQKEPIKLHGPLAWLAQGTESKHKVWGPPLSYTALD